MNKPRILTAGIAALLALPATVIAVERSWIANPGDGVWGNAANWDANGVPVSGVNDRIFVHTPGSVAGVAIDADVLFMAVGTAGAPASGYTFGAGTYNIGAIFVGEGHVGNGHGPAPINNNFGRAFIDAGTTVNVNAFHLGEWDGASGHVIQSGGDLNIGHQFRLGHWPQAGGAQNSYTMNGGSITMTGPAGDTSEGATGNVILGIDSSGTFNMNAGTFNAHGLAMQTRGAGGGESRLNMNGGMLNIGVNGFSSSNPGNLGSYDINLGGGTIRSTANWVSNLEMHLLSGGSGIVFDTNGSNATLSGAMNGAGGLTKSGAGKLLLSNAANNYMGATTISGGTFQLTSTGVSPDSDFTVQNTATLQIDAAGKTLKSLAIEGGSTLGLAAVTASTITLTNALTFTGTPNFTVKPILFNAPAVNDTFDLLTAGSVVGAPGTIVTDFGLSHASGHTNLVGNKLVLTIDTAGGILTWSNGAATGKWNINGDVNFIGADGKFLNGDDVTFGNTAAGTVTLEGTLNPVKVTVNATADYTFDGAGTISGGTGLFKSNTGTLNLGTIHDYGGGTFVSGNGVLNLTAQSGGTGTIRGAVTVGAGAELRATGGGGAIFGYTNGQKIDTFNIDGGLVNTIGGDNHVWIATVNMTGGEMRVNGGVSSPTGSALQWSNTPLNTFASASTATISGRMNLRADSGNTFTLNVADGGASTDLLISAAITEGGGMNITKNGAGHAEFSGGAGISGTLHTTGGALTLSGATAFGANQLLFTGGSSVTLANGANLTVNDLGFGIGGQNETVGGTLNVMPGTSFTTINARLGDSNGGGSLTQGTLNQTGGTVTVNAPNTDGRNFVLGHWNATHGLYNLSAGTLNSPNISMAVAWDGTGEFNISGTGIANMKGVRFGNHYNAGTNGALNLTGGQLNLGDEGIWATLVARPTDINLGGGTVRATAANVPITLPLELTGTNGDVTFDTNGNTITATGAITGTGGFTKEGAGTLVLNAANSADGIFTVNAGTLNVNADTALGGAASLIEIKNNATLQAGGAITAVARTVILGVGGGTIDTNGNTVTIGVGNTIGGTTLTKIGAGKLHLEGTQAYNTLNTDAGRTDIASALGTGTSTINADAETNISVSQTLAALNIGPGAVVTLGPLPAGAPPAPADDWNGDLAGRAAQAVPEPGTAALLLGGMLTLLGLRRVRSLRL